MTVPTPLILGPAEKAALQALRELASQHPVNMKVLMVQIKSDAGKRRHLQQMNRQTIRLPLIFDVTYSVETHHPGGTARHMSMSVRREGRVPSPEAVQMVCEELGFTGELKLFRVWLEDLTNPPGKAVNVVQLF